MITHRFRSWTKAFAAGGAVTALVACSVGVKDAETTAQARSADESAGGSCAPGSFPAEPSGACTPCPPLQTTGILPGATLNGLLSAQAIKGATYTIKDDLGQFQLGSDGASTPSLPITIPPPATISIPPILENTSNYQYSAYPTITSLTLSWPQGWAASDVPPAPGTVQVTAQLDGEVDVHVDANILGFPTPVNPKLYFVALPVYITIGVATNGDATVQVTLSQPVSAHVDVTGCGVVDICGGVISGKVEDAIQKDVPGTITSQLTTALNGANDSSPFWKTLLQSLANHPPANPLILDPAGNPLPPQGSSSAAGSPAGWVCSGGVSYTNDQVSCNFTTTGLCYIEPPPRCTVAAATSCNLQYVQGTTSQQVETIPVTCPGGGQPSTVEAFVNGAWTELRIFNDNPNYPGGTPGLYELSPQVNNSPKIGPGVGGTVPVRACTSTQDGTTCDAPAAVTVTSCCQKLTCGPNSCGTVPDGCGGMLTCPGTCGSGQTCTNGVCQGGSSCGTPRQCCLEAGCGWAGGKCTCI